MNEVTISKTGLKLVTVIGQMLTGQLVPTKKPGGFPRPEFVAWLMGVPADYYVRLATALCRKSPKESLPQSSKPKGA